MRAIDGDPATPAWIAQAQAQAQQQAPAPAQGPDDVVVTARRHGCQLSMADKALTNRQFDERAQLWAGGRPLRVIAPANASVKCLTSIAFKLGHAGVTRFHFVTPEEAATIPPATTPP